MFKNKFIKSNKEQDFYESVSTYSHEMSQKYDYILHALTSNLENPILFNPSPTYSNPVNSTNSQFINNINDLRVCFNNTASQFNNEEFKKESEKPNFQIHFGSKNHINNPCSIDAEVWFLFQEDLLQKIFNTINSSENKNNASNLNNFFVEINSDVQSKKSDILKLSFCTAENISIYQQKIINLKEHISVIRLVFECNMVQGNSVNELNKLLECLETAISTDFSTNRSVCLKNLWNSYSILNTSFQHIINGYNSPFKALYLELRSILFGK